MKKNKLKKIEIISIFVAVIMIVFTALIEPSNSNTINEQEIAETSPTEIIYIIGNHIFTEKTPYISSKMIMYAAKTIEIPEDIEATAALEYMHIYLRDLEGNWIDATTGELVDYNDLIIDIKYKDLEKYYLKKADVSTLEELEKALKDDNITTINLKNDLELTTSLILNKKVIITGNNNTIKYNGTNQEPVIITNSEDLTISNVNITGGTYAIENKGTLKLTETINVSGNSVNGIKNTSGTLNIHNATIKYDEESFLKPAVISTNNAVVKHNINSIKNITEEESHYYINKNLLKSEWTQIGPTITKGNIAMTVGDKVNYSVDGYEGNWVVFGVDNKHILLISEGYVNEGFELDGTPNNFEELSIKSLNDECAKYGVGKHALLARSVNIEDINRITGYDPITMEYGKGKDYEYGKQITYSVLGTPTTITSNYYSYMGEESVNIKKDSKAYRTIFGESYTADYWIASSFYRTFNPYFNRGIRVVAEDEVQRSYLKIYDNSWNNNKDIHAVRAVIELEDNTIITVIDKDNYKIEE